MGGGLSNSFIVCEGFIEIDLFEIIKYSLQVYSKNISISIILNNDIMLFGLTSKFFHFKLFFEFDY